MRVSVVVNSHAGTARRLGRAATVSLFKDQLGGALLSCRFVKPRRFTAACVSAIAESPDALVIVGGDGSARTAAELAMHAKIPLAALPGGTMNVLPKRLSGLMTLEECVAALGREAVEITKLDCGFADKRPFFVGAAFGMVPEMAKLREDFRVTKGVRDAARLASRVVKTTPRLMRPAVSMQVQGRKMHVPALIASVERVEHWGKPVVSDEPSPPAFDCVALCAERWREVAGIVAKAMWRGDWREHRCIEAFTAANLVVSSGRNTWLTLDGEPTRLPSPVKLRYAPARAAMIAFPEGLREVEDNDATDRSSVRHALSA